MFDTWALERHLVFKVNVNDTCLFVLHILRSKLLLKRRVKKSEHAEDKTNYIKIRPPIVIYDQLTMY